MLEYKGYIGKVELDDETGVLLGSKINAQDTSTPDI